MQPASKSQPSAPPKTSALLSILLKNSYQQHSLEHCFPSSKIIDLALQDKHSKIAKQLQQIEANSEDETMEGYFSIGYEAIKELTEYYKYYTQSSMLHLPSFFGIMYQHREMHKACNYNKFKILLDLSQSKPDLSSAADNLETRPKESSFFLLPYLTPAKSEESLLIEKLSSKLQKDLGPSRFRTLQQIDKQYIFTKKIEITPSKKYVSPKCLKQCSKQGMDTTTSFKKRVHKKRNNTCDTQLFIRSKGDSQSKIRRKKNASMLSLASVGKNTPQASESSKGTKTLLEFGSSVVKAKIMGMKQRIKQEKSELLKKSELTKKKPERVVKRLRN